MTTGQTVMKVDLPLPLVGRGKVRDIYDAGDNRLLIVTTDRLSAFDVIMPNGIPNKGQVLTQISVFWLNRFASWMPNHLITADIDQMNLPAEIIGQYGQVLRGRTMLVKKAKPLSIECVVRGYVTGSGWKDYLKTGSVCGHLLPANLKECAKLEKPLFTPATKEEEGHDINIDFDETVKREGADIAAKARDCSIRLYEEGRDYAATKGIIIADTKYEFGIYDNQLILIDEVLTPDSSRFWPKDQYEEGHDQPSYDKQIVRNYLSGLDWNKEAPGPELPSDVVEKTAQAYSDVFKKLTGQELNF